MSDPSLASSWLGLLWSIFAYTLFAAFVVLSLTAVGYWWWRTLTDAWAVLGRRRLHLPPLILPARREARRDDRPVAVS